MNWKRRNTISSYLSSSLWIIPIGAVILEQILSPIVRPIDARLSWSGLGLRIEGGARSCNAVVLNRQFFEAAAVVIQ
jgi:hypothetical protein